MGTYHELLVLSIFTSIFVQLSAAWFYGRDPPDRWSVGEIWPLPQQVKYGDLNRTICQEKVAFELGDKKDCDVLFMNAENYLNKWMFPFPVPAKRTVDEFLITVKVAGDCPKSVPKHGENEEYKLVVTEDGATISAETVWGAIRGIDSLSQLIFYDQEKGKYNIRTVEIYDFPRFPLRGLMIDTSRHFLSMKVIKRQLEIMAMNKMNVLHWHLVDSESFPYVSKKFPNLAKVGAYSPKHQYTPKDVQEIIDFARIRGIRVIPEFDLPGHTGSWQGQPELLTECFDSAGKPTHLPNLVDPSKNSTFEFLEEFLNEVVETFPDEYMHLGGDEVEDFIVDCWARNPKIKKFMEEKSFNNTRLLENYFFERLYAVLANLKVKKRRIFWQEVFDNNIPEENSIIHVWKGSTHEEILHKVKNVTANGFGAIVSACWYLNYIKYGADWKDSIPEYSPSNSRYYYCDPTNFEGTDEQKALVLGGIAAIWGEMVDDTNIESRLWPRASAVAERLWSPKENTKTAEEAWPRMHEQRCRMVARGFRFQPTNNPDFCPYEFDA
ncbi:unnamed protein product [Cylicocyclus nassatus]|uniref:Beta-hexosaminidase n=1 Tax=Cylicocyclus nassatus TaxID=53992 RepID=A0AA36H2H0_CYLNA|nr:unnamed protein product [Cylicocyclus nassatus]